MSLWTKIRDKVRDYTSGILKPIDDALGTDFAHIDDRNAQYAESNTAREFEANQKASDRQFNAQEAEKQRAWEEEMSNTARQRAVADAQAAGINPVLAAGGTSTGAVVPTGATASSSGGSAPMSTLPPSTARKMHTLEMLKTKAEIENTKADELYKLGAIKNEKNLTDAEVNKLRTDTKNASTRTTQMENDENFAKTWWGRNISPALRDIFGGGSGAIAAGAGAGLAVSKANSARNASKQPKIIINKH